MGWVARAWLACGLLLALTSRLAAEYLWAASFVPLLVWISVGVLLVIWCLLQARWPVHRHQALQRTAIVAMGFALFVPVANVGARLTERWRFTRERPDYDRVVARVGTRLAAVGPLTEDGLTYVVDPGPPTRVAFLWPGGIVDNWCGVVHDPSGEVLKVNDLGPFSDTWRSSPITKLFGGDMVSCRAADASYFFCCFT